MFLIICGWAYARLAAQEAARRAGAVTGAPHPSSWRERVHFSSFHRRLQTLPSLGPSSNILPHFPGLTCVSCPPKGAEAGRGELCSLFTPVGAPPGAGGGQIHPVPQHDGEIQGPVREGTTGGGSQPLQESRHISRNHQCGMEMDWVGGK